MYRSLFDSATTYKHFSLMYGGKPENTDGSAGKYYVTGTNEYTRYLVNELPTDNTPQGCNISMDRYFNSVPLAAWAIEKKFTIIGSMHHDQKRSRNKSKY